jgi:crossover junction endodeoxyribonuclease RusA
MVELTLPWPPSVNNYWRIRGNRFFISARGVQYRKDVIFMSYKYRDSFSGNQRILVEISAFPPDKRRRDLDNILKSLLDALQHAKVYEDDSQIDKLTITRYPEFSNKVIIKLYDYQGISSSTN